MFLEGLLSGSAGPMLQPMRKQRPRMNPLWRPSTFRIWSTLAVLFLASQGCQSEPGPPEVLRNGTKAIQTSPASDSQGSQRGTSFRPTTESPSSTRADRLVFDLQNPSSPDGENTPAPIIPKHSPRIGKKEASLQWVVFGSPNCPFTRKLFPEIREVIKTHGDRIEVVYLHAVPPHNREGEQVALDLIAMSSEAFWDEGVRCIEHGGAACEAAAKVTEASREPDDKQRRLRLEEDRLEAAKLRIRSTPQSIIAGKRITGAKSAATFRNHLDHALALRSQEAK